MTVTLSWRSSHGRSYRHETPGNLGKQSNELELYGKIHAELFNVPQLLVPGVQLKIKFTK
jgi:hypothetical protein